MFERKPLISVVSPVYGCRGTVIELYLRIKKALEAEKLSFELILVDDGSPDESWSAIEDLASRDQRVKGIQLSRNFGQHYAISAGLGYAKAEWIVVMDCDLQDQPEEIPKLYNKALEGFDIVFARRIERQDTFMKRVSSRLFHSIYSYLSDIKTDSTIANFGIFNKKVIWEFNRMKETSRSFSSLISYLGFKQSTVDVQHSQRYEGKTTYSLSKLLKLTGDIILSNSNKPLKLTIKLGFALSFLSFMLAIYNVFAYFTGIIKVSGFTSTIFSIWFVGGLIMFVLGIVGLYIGKIFEQVKERQLFIVKDTRNISEDASTQK
jgi:polyisoprenyl-phosphate glycosyltransferase